MTRFITSDWHLGEPRLKLMNRVDFNNPDHMCLKLRDLHNDIVNPDDIVYVLGDIVNKNTPEFLPWVNLFNGVKILIRGNHDRGLGDEQLKPYFEQIIPEGDGLEVEVGDMSCWLTHYPTQARSNRFNLVGHVHSAWKVQLNALNVGVDCNHFRPYNLDTDIPFVFNAIDNFYDMDVWCAYDGSNEQFVGYRGVANRYLDKK